MGLLAEKASLTPLSAVASTIAGHAQTLWGLSHDKRLSWNLSAVSGVKPSLHHDSLPLAASKGMDTNLQFSVKICNNFLCSQDP